MMGLEQGNRAAPPSWIQLSAVLVTIFKQFMLGALIQDPISAKFIHIMGALYVTQIYTHGKSTSWTPENSGAKLK
jgi:hypothetical protein